MAEFGFLNLGYNKEGYNKKGFDRQGYDREGYNKLGFNKDGYNKEGFDREGYNLEGYNKQGYNRLGYDKNGFNVKGINALGINVWGYDSSWHDKNGFDPLGYDKNGNNRYGFNRKGFNIDGNNTIREVPSGSDIKIDEFDKNGYSPDGVPKEGFNASLFLLEEQNGKGSKKQPIKTDKNQLEIGDIVYHQDLGEALIKEINKPYCTVVFTKNNEQMKFMLFDKCLSLTPSEKILELNSSFDEEDFDFEAKKLNETLDHLKNCYSSVLWHRINKNGRTRQTRTKSKS